jgi:hypothetical protein
MTTPTTHPGYSARDTAFGRLAYRVTKAGRDYGDDIIDGGSAYGGLEVDGPNGMVTVDTAASGGAFLTVQTLGLNAEGSTDDPRTSWKITFGEGVPSKVLSAAAQAAIEAIN